MFQEDLIKLYTESCDGPLPLEVSAPLMWYTTSVGCLRECNFCPTSRTSYYSLSPERVYRLLEHYKKNKIQTLLSGEDNFLARLLDKKKSESEKEQEIIEIMNAIRALGFAHEFSNGLEVVLLADSKGEARIKLIETLFARSEINGYSSGTYRLYWPIETFTRRTNFNKLSEKEQHYRILEAVLETGIPEIVFNTILFANQTPEEVKLLRTELREFSSWMSRHQRKTKWSIPIFHELPLPGARNYQKSIPFSFDIELHPELWAVPINPLNGKYYNYSQLYSLKRELMQEFDPVCLSSWDSSGIYSSSVHPC